MNKMKKKITTIIFILINIVGFYSTSKVYAAASIDIPDIINAPNVNTEYYKKTENMFCVEQGQKLAVNQDNKQNYDIIPGYIELNGNRAQFYGLAYQISDAYTGWLFDSDNAEAYDEAYWDAEKNAILAYILSAENNTSSKGYDSYGNVKDDGAVANAIWGFFKEWFDYSADSNNFSFWGSLGSGWEKITLNKLMKTESGKGFNYNQGYSNAAGNQLIAEARIYAKSLNSSGSQITNNPTNVKLTKIDSTYIKIGPFNWTFPGNMNNITANISLYGFYDAYGNTISESGVKSGKDFYVKLKKDDIKNGITFRLSGKAKVNKKRVRIYFLVAQGETANTKYQNLIYREKLTDGGQVNLTGTFTYTIPKLKGNLKIVKVNKDNQNVKLSGVGFIIKNEEGKYIRKYSDGSIGYVDRASATEFITNFNGEISINNLLIGTYTAYETKNPNYGYEFDSSGKTIEVNIGSTTQKIITNKQKYVKLSGKVWLDKISSKQSVRNNLYRSNSDDSADKLLDGITVSLKKRSTGKEIRTATTANGGKYLFKDVLISNLYDYYIEFEYDGLTYTNVVPYINNNNGSKAAEKTTKREEFNKNFSWVEGGENKAGTKGSNLGFTRYENGNMIHDLKYNISNHKATLVNKGEYKIRASTSVAGYDIMRHFTYGQEELKNINLGLYEREQPDIAIVQDIENVKVAINGQWHTYNYASRFLNMDTTKENKFDVGVKFGEKYGNKTYTRAIYQADSVYTDSNEDNELKVYVTYKITIKNESTTLSTVVHGIEDYFDSNYELYRVGSKLEANGNIATENNNIKAETPSKYNSNYMKTRIWDDSSDVVIPKQSEKDIYVQFKLDKQAVLEILADKENLDNAVEIENYSVYDKNGKRYAGIDKDSNPDNCTPGNKDTYEDDTDSAPGLKLVLQDERTTSGKVFLDSTEEGLKSGEVRQGSGKYENDEKGIKDVKVKLLNNTDGSIAQVYDQVSKGWKNAETTTDENGDYTIKGYIPGEYKIVYTWGDKTYKVQDYKGTIYQTSDRVNDDQWYKYKPEVRYSDAMDNYEERIKIDEQTKIITNANKQAIEKYDNEAEIEKEDGTKEKLITTMNSTTPVYKVNVEYRTGKTNSIDEYELDAKGNIKMNGDYVVKKEGHKNEIKNIDFGIVERARQLLDLEKRIKSATVTLANGHLLIDANAEKAEKGTNAKYTDFKVKKPDNPTPYLKIEVDAEIIQGATLDVVYGFEITNKSELDFTDKDFYLYGTIPKNNANIVTLNPNSIIDYLDNNLQPETQDTTNWNIIQGINQISDMSDQGLITEDVKTFLTNETSRILKQEGISAKLKPLDNENTADNETMTSLELKCSKLLASNDYSIEENHAEVIKIIKSGGSSLITTPGNYNPKDTGTSEKDNSDSEEITVMNNTGLETDFIAYTWLAICSLGILGVGIVIIRKYIMK